MPANTVFPFQKRNGVILGRITLIEPINPVFAFREAGASDELSVKILLGNRKDGRFSRLFAQ